MTINATEQATEIVEPMSAQEAQQNITTTVPLEFPVTVNGHTIAEITMHRPKVKDKRYAFRNANNAYELDVQMFTQTCGVDAATLDELDDKDFTKLQEAYNDFLL